jgi:hypothetical protein
MKTGRLSNTGVGNMQGVQMSTSEYDQKLLDKGYTIEQTPHGKTYSPPKK